jgi:GxxExxY protein
MIVPTNEATKEQSDPAVKPDRQSTNLARPAKLQPGRVTTTNDATTYQLIGLAMEVHNELGPGHREAAYHNALAAKIAQTELGFMDEPEFFIELEDGTTVQKYVPDFIVQDKILIELKAQTWPMTKDDMAQVFDYFAGTDCEEALFFNFGRPRLDYHRLLPPKHITLSRLRKSGRKKN